MPVPTSHARNDDPGRAATVPTADGDPGASPGDSIASDDNDSVHGAQDHDQRHGQPDGAYDSDDDGEHDAEDGSEYEGEYGDDDDHWDDDDDDDHNDDGEDDDDNGESDYIHHDSSSDSGKSVSSVEDNRDVIEHGVAMEDVLSDCRDYSSKDQFPIVGGYGRQENRWSSNTATIRDLAMMWFVNHVTDKHTWWRKVHDEESVVEWKNELDAIVETGIHPMQTGFSDPMFNFCLREIRDKAAIWEKMAKNKSDGGGGVVSVLDMAAAVFKSDGRIPEPMISALRDAARPFEGVAETDHDFERTSDGKVLDLVDPSLWPFVYDRSRAIEDGEIDFTNSLEHIGRGSSVASASPLLDKFQWLPTDISFGPNGTGKPTISGYINNVHPLQHRRLYPVIEQLFDISLPLLSAAYHRTMTWVHRFDFWMRWSDGLQWIEHFPERLRTKIKEADCTVPHICRQHSFCDSSNMPDSENTGFLLDSRAHREICNEWFHSTHTITMPVPHRYRFGGCAKYQTEGPWFKLAKRRPIGSKANEEAGENESSKEKARNSESEEQPTPNSQDHRLQVIVKLTNVHLTPDKPSYNGGDWHFDGGPNEHICATALFYYDSDNVTDSSLALRTLANSEDSVRYHTDFKAFQAIFGIELDEDDPYKIDSTYQELGHVATREGRLVVYPNVFQHRMLPFELEDKTRPGHQKVIALFLVDPAVRIYSTANVPPQQRHWVVDNPVDLRLPPELAHAIYKHVECPFDLDDAKQLRDELTNHRKADETNGDTPSINGWSSP